MTNKSMDPVVIRLDSIEATKTLAFRIADILEEGDLLLFTGEIGAGKTTFIQFLARRIGVKEAVTSPTFVIHMLRDSGRILLSHVDLYRLENDDQVECIGFEEYYDEAITVVEWADRYSGFTAPYIKLHFEYGNDENERIVTITPIGGEWDKRLSAIL